MGRTTKPLSGQAKTRYLKGVLTTEPSLDQAASKRLLDLMDQEITLLRVRLPVTKRAPVVTPSAPVPAPSRTSTAESFDPHAFSLVVVMSKQGAEGLLKRLESIADPDQLCAIAKAQHIAIPEAAGAIAELRAALIAGTAQRIADRRAAAS